MPIISEQELRKLLQPRGKTSGGRLGATEDSNQPAGRPSMASRRRSGQPQKKKRWTIPSKVRQYFPYVVAFLALLTPLLHNPPRDNTVPPYLIGIWRSDTPKYEDRYLRFLEHHLIFGTGGYEGEPYIVAEVRTEPADEGEPSGAGTKTLVIIRYMKADKLEYELSFYYKPKPVETITFKNQDKLIWTKKGREL